MDNPYQSPKTDLTPQQRTRSMSAFSVGALAFAVGYVATIVFWYVTLPGPGQCPPPCDSPGMVLGGIIIFGGPLIGIVFASVSLLVRALIVWRSRRHAA